MERGEEPEAAVVLTLRWEMQRSFIYYPLQAQRRTQSCRGAKSILCTMHTSKRSFDILFAESAERNLKVRWSQSLSLRVGAADSAVGASAGRIWFHTS